LRCGRRRDRWVSCARRFVVVGIRGLAEWWGESEDRRCDLAVV